MKDWLGRRRGSHNHPGLGQVDRLLTGRPQELAVPISGLPGQLDELFSIYEGLFELRDYRVEEVDRRLDDLWIAHLTRKPLKEELVNGSGSVGSTERR